MKKKNLISKVLVLALALVMVFTMTAAAFANTNTGTATLKIYIVNDAGVSSCVRDVTVDAGQSVYDVIEALDGVDDYDPHWTTSTDYYNGDTVYYLDSLKSRDAENVAHQYNADGSGWSRDWGWLYTVNGTSPAFSDNPEHGMAMNQYTIQNGDTIDVAYTLTYTSWDANYDTDYTIVYPWD